MNHTVSTQKLSLIGAAVPALRISVIFSFNFWHYPCFVLFCVANVFLSFHTESNEKSSRRREKKLINIFTMRLKKRKVYFSKRRVSEMEEDEEMERPEIVPTTHTSVNIYNTFSVGPSPVWSRSLTIHLHETFRAHSRFF